MTRLPAVFDGILALPMPMLIGFLMLYWGCFAVIVHWYLVPWIAGRRGEKLGRLEAEESGERVTYQIVGEDEADLKLGLVNISSPIARALIGKEEGDTAIVMAPGGQKAYEIVAVRYV